MKITAAFLAIAICLSSKAQLQPSVDKIVAVIGDHIILRSEIQGIMEDLRRQGEKVSAKTACDYFEQALIQKILLVQAERDSIIVADEEVEREVQYAVNKVMRESPESNLNDFFQQSIEKYRNVIKERKLTAAVIDRLTGNIKITPSEIKAFFDKILKDSLPLIETAYEVGQVILYPKASAGTEQYIIAEMNNYKKLAESKIAGFDQLARRYSEDPGSKERGGSYQVNRNDKTWDPAFLNASFRLREGEISAPVKSDKFGFFLIQMVEKRGDDAEVRLILRVPPVTDAEVVQTKARLDSIRKKIVAGNISFQEAAYQYSDDESIKYAGAFILNKDGSSYVNMDQMDREMPAVIIKMKPGDLSSSLSFTDEQGRKGFRMLYLKSKKEAHVLNFRDDYILISSRALEEKKSAALNKWINQELSRNAIAVDKKTMEECPAIKRSQGITVLDN